LNNVVIVARNKVLIHLFSRIQSGM